LVSLSNKSISNHSNVLGKISDFAKITEAEAINRIFGWPESYLNDAKKLIIFKGFI